MEMVRTVWTNQIPFLNLRSNAPENLKRLKNNIKFFFEKTEKRSSFKPHFFPQTQLRSKSETHNTVEKPTSRRELACDRMARSRRHVRTTYTPLKLVALNAEPPSTLLR